MSSSDRGQAAIELALAVGVLLLPVALVVVSFGPWSERRVAAESMAAEAARAAVLDLDEGAGLAVLTSLVAGAGYPTDTVRLGWCGATPAGLSEPGGSCSFVRGSAVQATVQVWTPLISTPWGGVGGLWVTADHSEPVDLYRSLG